MVDDVNPPRGSTGLVSAPVLAGLTLVVLTKPFVGAALVVARP